MRVMLFSDTYPPQVNGVANCVYNLAHALHEDGHTVMVCTVLAKRRIRVQHEEPFPVIRARAMPVPMYTDFSLAPPVGLALARVVRRFRPDLVHCHTPFSIGWHGVRACNTYRIPVIGTHHTLFGDYVDSYLRLGHQMNARIASLIRRYVARFYNQCDLTSCASHFLAQDLVSGGMRRPMRIVHNPVNTTRFRPLAPAERAPRAPGTRRIVYFGRLAAEKNLPQLVHLVEPALRRHREMKLEIVGDGPMMAPLIAQATQLGIEEQVCFRGWMHGEALARLVAACDICVSASTTENQPLALLESLACGVPVVALAAAGVPEIITDGATGYLVDPADASALFAHRIETLLADDALRGAMSERARATAQRYSPDACLHANLALYAETLNVARCAPLLRRDDLTGLRARRRARSPQWGAPPPSRAIERELV
jgi:glycosyltransferase involved in cell wall biosynthesis